MTPLAAVEDPSPIRKASDVDASKALLLTEAGKLYLVDASSQKFILNCRNFVYDFKRHDSLYFVLENNLSKIEQFKSVWKTSAPKTVWKNLSSNNAEIGLLEEKNQTLISIIQDGRNPESYTLLCFDGKTLKSFPDFFMLDAFAPDEMKEFPAEFELTIDPCFGFLVFSSSVSATFKLAEFDSFDGIQSG